MELTFAILCGLEPLLKKLDDEIRDRPRTEWDDVMYIWAEEYKDRMKALVGYRRKNKAATMVLAPAKPMTSRTLLCWTP